MEPCAIADVLRASPLHSIDEASEPTGVPDEPGFYAWWVTSGAIADVSSAPHPSEPYELLYVGIAPSRPRSSARLRSRLLRQHIGGNIASSTFRFGLAALLWQKQGWTPRQSSSGRFRLDRHDDRALRSWQRTHLRLRWCAVEQPWLVEAAVVHALKPPMNREHNHEHPFFTAMGDARARFRERARSR